MHLNFVLSGGGSLLLQHFLHKYLLGHFCVLMLVTLMFSAGKSFFARHYLIPKGYVYVNQVKYFYGCSVNVNDNTNNILRKQFATDISSNLGS